jgi:hypothetical protein
MALVILRFALAFTGMRALKIRTGQGMIALSGEEARALRDRLAQSRSAQAASATFSVSANASTSITFTDIEKAAVHEVLEGWLEHISAGAGLIALRDALARDLSRQDSTSTQAH